MKLTIKQRPENGFLGGPKNRYFSVCHEGITYEIAIEQCGERKITITSPEGGTYNNALEVYYTLETLLMLFDGQFYPVVSAFDGDTEVTSSWKRRALPCYHSADFMVGTGNALLDFEKVLNWQLLEKWFALKKELDLIHNMVLYCLSSVEMPKDMQCAFMIEAFEGLCELVEQRMPEITFPRAKKGESQLQKYLLTIIPLYGTPIFEKEMQCNAEIFTQILVDSRNKIGHIKSKQGRTYLDGECVMYLMKLSLLYRVVLFDLLGIPSDLCSNQLNLRVQAINDHEVMQNFLKKLGETNGRPA